MNKTELQENGVTYTTMAFGSSDWYENVAIPFDGEIDAIIPQHVGEIPDALRERMTRAAVNDPVGYMVIGVSCYLLGKIADDFYDVVLKPHVRKCFEGRDGKLGGGSRKARKVFVSNIWYKEHQVVVSVSVVGKDLAEVAAEQNFVGAVHSNALKWIEQHGVLAPVHHYRIEGGKVNEEPMPLNRADEATKP